jgi:hypothetical protein
MLDGKPLPRVWKTFAARPEVTARWVLHEKEDFKDRAGFRLMLQNTGQPVAANVSALPIEKLRGAFLGIGRIAVGAGKCPLCP